MKKVEVIWRRIVRFIGKTAKSLNLNKFKINQLKIVRKIRNVSLEI